MSSRKTHLAQTVMRRRFRDRNAAFSIGELVVSLTLLTVALIGVGRFVRTVHSGLKQRELSQLIGWEIANARDSISTWKPEAISVERINALPISKALSSRLDSVHWHAVVDPVTQPVDALRITLTLQCVFHEQASEPDRLVFWLPIQGEGDDQQ